VPVLHVWGTNHQPLNLTSNIGYLQKSRPYGEMDWRQPHRFFSQTQGSPGNVCAWEGLAVVLNHLLTSTCHLQRQINYRERENTDILRTTPFFSQSSKMCYLLFFLFCFVLFFPNVGDQTLDPIHTRQTLYNWATPRSISCSQTRFLSCSSMFF
jgi:hypothetical protein